MADPMIDSVELNMGQTILLKVGLKRYRQPLKEWTNEPQQDVLQTVLSDVEGKIFSVGMA